MPLFKNFQSEQAYNAVIFKGRNQMYGAFQLRQNYETNVRKALAVLLLLVVLLWLSKLWQKAPPVNNLDTEGMLIIPIDITPIHEPYKPIPIQPIEQSSGGGAHVSSEQFTNLKVVKDQQVKPQERIADVDSLKDKVISDHKQVGDSVNALATTAGNGKGLDGDGEGESGGGKKPDQQPGEYPTYVDVMPSFPGGEVALMRFLQSHLEYPSQAREMGQEGRVLVSFVINEMGAVEDIKIIRGFGYGSEEAAQRVITKMPKWIPGKQNGTTVKVKLTLPIKFKLS